MLAFTDPTGREWQVVQVQRTSGQPGAVSAGRDHGWLSFIAADERRRLAPFPAEWESSSLDRLWELCQSADLVRPLRGEPRIKRKPRPAAGAATRAAAEETEQNTESRASFVEPPSEQSLEPAAAASAEREPERELEPALERDVRAHAAGSRAAKRTVVDALIELKHLLARRGFDRQTGEFRSARRIFLDAFYFSDHSREK